MVKAVTGSYRTICANGLAAAPRPTAGLHSAWIRCSSDPRRKAPPSERDWGGRRRSADPASADCRKAHPSRRSMPRGRPLTEPARRCSSSGWAARGHRPCVCEGQRFVSAARCVRGWQDPAIRTGPGAPRICSCRFGQHSRDVGLVVVEDGGGLPVIVGLGWLPRPIVRVPVTSSRPNGPRRRRSDHATPVWAVTYDRFLAECSQAAVVDPTRRRITDSLVAIGPPRRRGRRPASSSRDRSAGSASSMPMKSCGGAGPRGQHWKSTPPDRAADLPAPNSRSRAIRPRADGWGLIQSQRWADCLTCS